MLKRIAFLLSMLAVVPAASAQFSTAGMTLRPHLVGAAWTIDNTTVDAESGGGIGLGFDYGFSELIAAYVELSGSSIDGAGGESYALAHVDLGARFTFGSRH